MDPDNLNIKYGAVFSEKVSFVSTGGCDHYKNIGTVYIHTFHRMLYCK